MLGYVGPEPGHPRFQIVVNRNGLVGYATDVPLMGSDVVRLGIEAMAQNLGMGQLLTQAVTTAIKKNMIQEILGGPLQERTPQAITESSLASGRAELEGVSLTPA